MMYNGICCVASVYTPTNKLDLLNTSPTVSKIRYGTGYICKIDSMCYVVTCNHIMVQNAAYYGIYNGAKIKLKPILRIFEIDVVILAAPLMFADELSICATIETNITNAVCISANSEIFFNTDAFAYTKVKLNTLVLQHGSVYCSALMDQPYYCFNYAFQMKGHSGSIIQSNTQNVAMLFAANANTETHYALPLKYIDYIVRTMVTNNIHSVVTISLATQRIIFDVNDKTDIEGQIVTCKSVKYQLADKKTGMYFHSGMIIERIDDKPFERGKIYSEELDMCVCMNCYFFLSCLAKRKILFSFYSGNFSNKYTPIKQAILNGKQLCEIFVCPPHTKLKYIIWKNMIFAELTEELFEYCSNLKSINKFLTYKSFPQEQCVVCVVKNGKPINKILPHTTLYQIDKIYNKKITSMTILKQTLYNIESKPGFYVSMTNIITNNTLKLYFNN